jgi:hypothetical protein
MVEQLKVCSQDPTIDPSQAMQSFLVGDVLSPQTSGEVTNTRYESMPASLGLMRPQIQAFEQGSVVDKPYTS